MPSDKTGTQNPIFCAIDTPSLIIARDLVLNISPYIGGLKIGLEFFCANGPSGVQDLIKESELPVFLDLKFHDIPNTVMAAINSVSSIEPFIINVHASGGQKMMEAARDEATSSALALGCIRPLVFGVTILTSISAGELDEIGIFGPPNDVVLQLASLAREAGLDGVVCSPHEVSSIKEACGSDFKVITPGVRPLWSQKNDQKRVMTPALALAAGADYLVIGRPITASEDPRLAAEKLAAEIGL
jgi:orotidine-5'-phosphate decarboxylase